MQWTIRQIFDGDYGCEEPGPDDSPKVSVTLVNDDGEVRYVSVEDAWLTAQGLDEGSVWPAGMTPTAGMAAITHSYSSVIDKADTDVRGTAPSVIHAS